MIFNFCEDAHGPGDDDGDDDDDGEEDIPGNEGGLPTTPLHTINLYILQSEPHS